MENTILLTGQSSHINTLFQPIARNSARKQTKIATPIPLQLHFKQQQNSAQSPPPQEHNLHSRSRSPYQLGKESRNSNCRRHMYYKCRKESTIDFELLRLFGSLCNLHFKLQWVFYSLFSNEATYQLSRVGNLINQNEVYNNKDGLIQCLQ